MQNDIGFVMTSVTTIMLAAITLTVFHTAKGELKIYAVLSWFAILLAGIQINTKYPINASPFKAFVIGFKGLIKSPTDIFCTIAIIVIGSAIISAILLYSELKKNRE